MNIDGDIPVPVEGVRGGPEEVPDGERRRSAWRCIETGAYRYAILGPCRSRRDDYNGVNGVKIGSILTEIWPYRWRGPLRKSLTVREEEEHGDAPKRGRTATT
jgi:hypothetical protein